ncbi:MAG: 1-acyl-sn-glycerol-3-phosphate acyltransferase [Halobacteriovoraceae bacterium]|nr:1-acyl-sn-glycerol-3-phosphate acyltransferase [Halobacteriovoraceae bacterium]MCB9095080.1 1-acyl-sn-glycerol-3-phosphate acyltransferase [Halobacteriovoraceae bacterium]
MSANASIEEAFWTYPKVIECLEQRAEDKKHFQKVFEEIHGEFNEGLIDRSIKFIDKTFLKLYDGINLETPYGFDLDELSKDNHVILVPNHQSHADYVAITYIFYKTFRKPIYVAGGINLNIFLLGSYFRKTGAFFIRRSFGQDQIYKIAFESYIYSLLKNNNIVEFFFEGGRSRTGKLLSPRFGLFHMLLESHAFLEEKKPLLFIPVSIAHEYVPEEKAHARELGGEKKVKEKPTQILKIFKLFNKKLGTIHIRFGKGIPIQGYDDLRTETQELAFQCFRAVGNGMPITPTSLLSLILLDAPSGVITWDDIERKAFEIIGYAKRFSLPLTPSLAESDQTAKYSVNKALNILVKNKKIDVLQSDILGDIYYSIKKEERIHLLYFKNMILHHFIVPGLMSSAWYHLKNGNFKTVNHFRKYLLEKRNTLKFEFYLPSSAEMFNSAMEIASYATGKNIETIEDCLNLNEQEMDQIACKVSYFSTAFSYINECYYIAAVTLQHLTKKSFNQETFLDTFKDIFNIELNHGRIVQYAESYLIPMIKNTLKFFEHVQCLEVSEDCQYTVLDPEKIKKYQEEFAEDININVVMNLKLERIFK